MDSNHASTPICELTGPLTHGCGIPHCATDQRCHLAEVETGKWADAVRFVDLTVSLSCIWPCKTGERVKTQLHLRSGGNSLEDSSRIRNVRVLNARGTEYEVVFLINRGCGLGDKGWKSDDEAFHNYT